MAKRAHPKAFQDAMGKIAQTLVVLINDKLKDRKWKLKNKKWISAYVDRRGSLDTAIICKLRITMEDQSSFARLHTSSEIENTFDEIWRSKDSIFPEKWYGVKLTVTPEGKWEVALDHDPKCVEDPTFFDPA